MTQFGFIEREVHKSEIRHGDTIRHNGHEMTVSKSDIRHDPFMGKTIFGDSYKLGYQKVVLLEYKQISA